MTTQEFITYQEQTFDAYCKRLFRNESLDVMRERARQARREIELSALSVEELSDLAKEDRYDFEWEKMPLFVQEREVVVRERALAEAIYALPPKYRDAVLLFYFFDLGDAEIGSRINVAPNTVRYRRLKALERLRTALEGLPDEK